MLGNDPFTADGYHYECRTCLDHVQTAERIGTCPTCGGPVTNLAVPRE